MQHVIIGVDSYKLFSTMEVIGEREQLRGSVRFRIDRAGYAAIVNKLVPDPTRFAG